MNFDYKQNLIDLFRQLGMNALEIKSISKLSQEEAKQMIDQINSKLEAKDIPCKSVTNHPEVEY